MSVRRVVSGQSGTGRGSSAVACRREPRTKRLIAEPGQLPAAKAQKEAGEVCTPEIILPRNTLVGRCRVIPPRSSKQSPSKVQIHSTIMIT